MIPATTFLREEEEVKPGPKSAEVIDAHLQGVLQRLDMVMVKDLRRISEQAGCIWDPNEYLKFLQEVLAWMRTCSSEADLAYI